MIVNLDTDVVVIALNHFSNLNIEELWVEIGINQHRRWLPIRIYARILTDEICKALPFWFSITGCDTVSMSAGRGKKTAWKIWQKYPDITETFVRYVYFHYIFEEQLTAIIGLNECSKNLFLAVVNILSTLSGCHQACYLVKEDFARIERSLVFLYDATSTFSGVNECHRYLLTKKDVQLKAFLQQVMH